MSDFTTALKAEMAELEADLRANPDPRVRKLQRLRETLAEYEPQSANMLYPNGVPRPNGGATLELQPAAPGLAAATKAERLKAHISEILREEGSTHRKDLLESLIAAGIMGGEKDPMQALAIYLSSNKDIFEFDGSGNYKLREPEPSGGVVHRRRV